MDLSITPPDTGAGGAAPSPVQVLTDLQNPTKLKRAKKYIDLVKAGTRRRVILLGQAMRQRAHWSAEAQRKVICTARLGQCRYCALVGIDKDVGVSHFEYYLPCALQTPKDRLYVQTTLVLTEDMYAGTDKLDGLKDLVGDGPERGHALELHRESKHGFKWLPVRGAPKALAHVLPAAFDVAPWMRVRFGLVQDPQNLPTLFNPFCLGTLASAPAAKVHELELAPTDVQPAAEVGAIKEAIGDRLKKWGKAAPAAAPALAPEATDDETETPAAAPAAGLTPEPAGDEPEPTPAAPPARPGFTLRTPTRDVVFVPVHTPKPKDEPAAGAFDAVIGRVAARAGKGGAK